MNSKILSKLTKAHAKREAIDGDIFTLAGVTSPLTGIFSEIGNTPELELGGWRDKVTAVASVRLEQLSGSDPQTFASCILTHALKRYRIDEVRTDEVSVMFGLIDPDE